MIQYTIVCSFEVVPSTPKLNDGLEGTGKSESEACVTKYNK